MNDADTPSPLHDVMVSHRDIVLEEAATIVEQDRSPFHSVRSTELFWEAQRVLAAQIRDAKGSK